MMMMMMMTKELQPRKPWCCDALPIHTAAPSLLANISRPSCHVSTPSCIHSWRGAAIHHLSVQPVLHRVVVGSNVICQEPSPQSFPGTCYYSSNLSQKISKEQVVVSHVCESGFQWIRSRHCSSIGVVGKENQDTQWEFAWLLSSRNLHDQDCCETSGVKNNKWEDSWVDFRNRWSYWVSTIQSCQQDTQLANSKDNAIKTPLAHHNFHDAQRLLGLHEPTAASVTPPAQHPWAEAGRLIIRCSISHPDHHPSVLECLQLCFTWHSVSKNQQELFKMRRA